MRYEEGFRKKKNHKNLLHKLEEDIMIIERAIANYFIGSDREYCYCLINDLLLSILTALIPEDDEILRNEVTKIMGGHSLQTPTTIILDQGIKQGIKQGIEQGIALGAEKTQFRLVKSLMRTQGITVDEAMERLEISSEDRKKILQNIQ